MIAKKFHEKRSEQPRRKRSVMEGPVHKPNPYLVGPHLRTEKKNGKHAGM